MSETIPVVEKQKEATVNIAVRVNESTKIIIPSVSIVETSNIIKQALFEYQESGYYTCYKLELAEKGVETIELNDFVELSNYLQEKSDPDEPYEVKMIMEDYNIKKARMHLKRTREFLEFPSTMQGSISNLKKVGYKNETSSNDDIVVELPGIDNITSDMKLNDFFENTLLRTGKIDHTVSSATPCDSIKSVTVSGWNPPPPARKLQGDLLYIEVESKVDGILQITACPSGFYINKSTRHSFDPSPALNSHFSHELFPLLCKACPTLQMAWSSFENINRDIINDNQGALDDIATLFSQGRQDILTKRIQWNIVPVNLFKNRNGSTAPLHKYDINRAQEDLCDSFGIYLSIYQSIYLIYNINIIGMEDKGAPREWNEEIQSIRSLPVVTTQDKIMKTKYAYKLSSEFSEACKNISVAISDGHISPINPMEHEQTHVYVYNNIFISRSIDTKETFKLCSGDDASSKFASHDLRNQKLIQSLEIEGIHTVLSSIVDYKGERFIGQTIIPGVLQSGNSNARLMYGCLEQGKRVSCKESAFKTMTDLCEKIYIKPRSIAAIPMTVPESENVEIEVDTNLNPEDIATSPIRIDDKDEVNPPDSLTIPHVGPLEGKILSGSDGRSYVLEMMRLTPRDANYVIGEKGTKVIKEEDMKYVDNELANSYILRHELINIFLQRKLSQKRQSLIIAAAQKAEEEKKSKEVIRIEGDNDDDQSLDNSLTESETNEINSLTPSKLIEKSPEKSAEKSDENPSLNSYFTPELTEELKKITIESLGLDINPNVFLNYDCDSDAAVVLKDEETARELATFLWTILLPNITSQIRVGDYNPIDNDALVNMLHAQGINLRYLGQLARLADEQEKDDLAVSKEGKQRIQVFPQYWKELLEIEMLSRSIKHLIKSLLKSSQSINAAPAATIASMFNHIFGSDVSGEKDVSTTTTTTTTTNDVKSKSDKNKKKKNKNKSTIATSTASYNFNSTDSTLSRKDIIDQLLSISRSKFAYNLSFVNSKHSEADSTNIFLYDRINKLTLLRRICQLGGVRIATKNYDFSSSTPFSIADIICLVPCVKTCEPDVPLPEGKDLLNSAAQHFQEGNIQLAFEIIQEASNWIGQV
jgi:protein TIF31